MSKIDRAIAEGHLFIVHKHITMDADLSNGTNQSNEDLFTITGIVRVLRLYGYVETAALNTDVTLAYFDTFPTGGAAVELTKAALAPDISSYEVGSLLIKGQQAGAILNALRANVAMLLEEDADYKKTGKSFIVGKKNGAVTTIRFNWSSDTDHTSQTGVIDFIAVWEPVSDDGELVPA